MIDLNLLRSKTVGPSPAGPLGAKAKSRAAGFVAGRSFGLSKNKKSKAGAKAGIGHKGRSAGARPATTFGGGAPRGPAGAGLNPSGGPVRLPNRKRFGGSSSSSSGGVKGFVGGFFKRFRKGS